MRAPTNYKRSNPRRDPWLELYPEKIEYWLPAWKSESALVDNVEGEVSLIYHTGRTSSPSAFCASGRKNR